LPYGRPIHPGVEAIEFLGKEYAVLVAGSRDQRDALVAVEVVRLGQCDPMAIPANRGVHHIVRALDQRQPRVLDAVLLPELEGALGGGQHAGLVLDLEVEAVAAAGQRKERVALLTLDADDHEILAVELDRRAVEHRVAAEGHVVQCDDRVAFPSVEQVSST
jgi:hypothetical protein